MHAKAAITVLRSREEVERLWRSAEYQPPYIASSGAAMSFRDAPGDRGSEIHVDLEYDPPAGKLGDTIAKLAGASPLAKIKDDLRRFKQRVETGGIPRSDATPEGESAERKLRQRPAQPLSEAELEEVGVR
jgi:uncharacterized membrane protein